MILNVQEVSTRHPIINLDIKSTPALGSSMTEKCGLPKSLYLYASLRGQLGEMFGLIIHTQLCRLVDWFLTDRIESQHKRNTETPLKSYPFVASIFG